MPDFLRRASRLALPARSASNPVAARPSVSGSAARVVGVLALLVLALLPARHAGAQAADAAPAGDSLFAPKSAWDAPEPWRTDRWYLQTSLATWHFHYDANHEQAALVDLSYYYKERWLDGQWFAGLALFTNSFGQFSQYLYGGLKWRPWAEQPPFYVKVSAGVVHGYSGEYQDKIPFNSTGFAPGIIPSVGYCWNRWCGEVVLLGFNALLFNVGVTMP